MSIESELKRLDQRMSDLVTEVDEVTDGVTSLVRKLEQDDHFRERAAAVEEKERDDRHQQIMAALSGLSTAIGDSFGRIDNALKAVATALQDLPPRLLDHVEAKTRELRVARYEALRAGVANEPAPLPPTPTRREPTGKIIAQIEGKDESAALTPAQQRGIAALVKRVWSYKFHIGGGGILGAGGHWLWERIVDLVRHMH